MTTAGVFDFRAHEIFRNSTFLKEFASNISFMDFYKIYSQAKADEWIAFDTEEVAAGILAGNDTGKKLVLALFARGGRLTGGLNNEQILALAEISPAHKLALLSNVRMDWYAVLIWDKENVIREKL